mgnify:FL=1
MANRRMFSLEVCDTDRFMEMPLSTQGLYLQLGLRADDDGFISSPKRIVAMVGGSNDDLRLLIAKGYLIPFENGIVVITDWNINNWIRPDRKHNTRFEKEKALLALENGSYSLDDICQPNDNQMTTQCHTEVSIDKYSIDNINNNSASPDAPKESNAEIESFFESIWKLYPNKKGKAAVSKTKKKELFKVGYDEMSRAINRYVTDLKAEEWRKPQYGSSFFNKGYVDYLDKNYTAAVASDPEKGDRSIYKHDYEELKRELGID